jgi:hypothetical protein
MALDPPNGATVLMAEMAAKPARRQRIVTMPRLLVQSTNWNRRRIG